MLAIPKVDRPVFASNGRHRCAWVLHRTCYILSIKMSVPQISFQLAIEVQDGRIDGGHQIRLED